MTSVSAPPNKTNLPLAGEIGLPSQKKATFRINLGAAIAMAVAAAYLSVVYSQTGSWQSANLAIITGVISILCFVVLTPAIRNDEVRVTLVFAIVSIVFIVGPALITAFFIISSPFLIIFAIFLASIVLTNWRATGMIIAGIALAILASLADVFTPYTQITAHPIIGFFALFPIGLILIFILLFRRNVISFSLRVRLLMMGLAAVLIPVFLITLLQVSQINQTFNNQTNQSLRFAAQQTSGKIDEFLRTNRDSIVRDASLPVFINYLSLAPGDRSGSKAEADLRLTIETLQKRPQAFLSSYGLLNLSGMNIFDTNPVEVGRFEASHGYYQVPLISKQPYISNVEFSTLNGDPFIFFSSPILNKDQNVIGVLRARFDASVFQKTAQENAGLLGLRSYPILFDENQFRLADTITPSFIFKSVMPITPEKLGELQDQRRIPDYPLDKLSTSNVALATSIANGKENPFFTVDLLNEESYLVPDSGTISFLSVKPWSVVYVQEQEVLTNLLRQQVRFTTLFATLIAGVIGLLALLAARLLTQPIMRLTNTAAQITSGNLDVSVETASKDEIGTLATAFNAMTSRLRTMIYELEDRVRARTRELETQNSTLVYRNQQIQTISDVARNIAGAQELEILLTTITGLISERFGFYHVGIFLIDETKEFAVLRASNSEGGRKMLARQHKLEVGQVGIVGNVTSTGKARIALDVGEDAVHFKNADLPLTRSEMALPLILGTEIIGALDVQSEKTNAFSEQDVELFNTLSDQIAIAISNSRLYQETRRALEESQILHRQYLTQEWARFEEDEEAVGYKFASNHLIAQGAEKALSIDPAVVSGKISTLVEIENGQPVKVLQVPITLRGETIGVIHLKDNNQQKTGWSAEEIETANAIATQASQALENARLFEQTIRRADRERRVLEITNRIRSTNDPASMMQIAREELQRALNASAVEFVLAGTEQDVDGGNGKNGDK